MRNRNKNKGFTFIELIVTVAVMAVAMGVLIGSYVTVMENQRQKADVGKLNNIDISLQEVFLYKDAFEEAKSVVVNDYMLDLEFKLEMESDGKAFVPLNKATINGSSLTLEEACPRTCEYLIDLVGDTVYLDSGAYKRGTYNIHIEFGGAQLTEIRDFEITNDCILISNSGAENMYHMD